VKWYRGGRGDLETESFTVASKGEVAPSRDHQNMTNSWPRSRIS